MNTKQVEEFAEEQFENLEKNVASKSECARDFAERMRVRSNNLLEATREEFRSNPVSFMAGVLTLGFALGCIVMSGRHHVSPQQRFYNRSRDQANDFVANASDRLSHAAANLKFW